MARGQASLRGAQCGQWTFHPVRCGTIAAQYRDRGARSEAAVRRAFLVAARPGMQRPDCFVEVRA